MAMRVFLAVLLLAGVSGERESVTHGELQESLLIIENHFRDLDYQIVGTDAKNAAQEVVDAAKMGMEVALQKLILARDAAKAAQTLQSMSRESVTHEELNGALSTIESHFQDLDDQIVGTDAQKAAQEVVDTAKMGMEVALQKLILARDAAKAAQTSQSASLHGTSGNNTAIHCNSFCAKCKDGHGVYISRGSGGIFKYVVGNVWSAIHVVGRNLPLINKMMGELPDECPALEVVTNMDGHETSIKITKDTGEFGGLPLFMKNVESVYRKDENCWLCMRPSGHLPPSLETEMNGNEKLCGGDHEGMAHLTEYGLMSSIFSLGSDSGKKSECVMR